jgi:ubiquinone/menaquinone biosynthesis C-methylase UbiE
MKLPFRNDIFDLSVRIGVLMHLESAQDALLEFSRILKTRGLLISDNVNNSLIGHIYVVGFNFTRALIHGGVFKVLEKYLKTRRVGSRISTSYSLKEQQDLHQKANLTIIKMKEYGNKYFPWIFLTLSRRRSLQFSQMFFNY